MSDRAPASGTNQSDYLLSQGPVCLAVNQGYHSDCSALFAGLTIPMLPVLAVYLALRGHLQSGLTVGAIR